MGKKWPGGLVRTCGIGLPEPVRHGGVGSALVIAGPHDMPVGPQQGRGRVQLLADVGDVVDAAGPTLGRQAARLVEQEAPAALGGMMTGQSQAPKTRKKSPKRLTALKRHSRKPGGRK